MNLDKDSNVKAWLNDFKDELLVAIMGKRQMSGGAVIVEEAKAYKERRDWNPDHSVKDE